MLDGTDRWPDREYLIQGERRITHARLRESIPAAAGRLAASGVGPGDRVMILAYNSPEFVIALWSIWWLGAVAVFGNRWWHPGQTERALAETGSRLLITDRSDRASPVPAVPISDLGHPAGPAAASAPPDDEDAPALIVFTSGSTGAPKGVVLSHRSVVANQQNLLVRQGRMPGGPRDDAPPTVLLVCTPLFHIGGVSHMLTPLITGGTLVLTEGRFDPRQVLDLIERERIHVFGGVPTMAIRVIEHPEFSRFDLSSLRAFPLGGAPVAEALLHRLAAKVPQLGRRGLANTWGMTESGGYVTAGNSADMARFPGTVGRPYPCAEIRIAPDADGPSGEVLVRSPTVMLHYLGGPDGTVDEDGWLHTGDIGHINDDGYLFLDGRAKDIVIRGGENVACAHVEGALLEHPDVLEAAVFGAPDADLGETVVAVIVTADGRPLDEGGLREHLASRLAYFEIPAQWFFRTEPLPTLPGEKIDKVRLAHDVRL
jgi:acyl-CoA synthetase (AMP-forming)/AMP-acid ligase II